MSQMSDYLEGKLSNFLLDGNTGSFTAPGSVYLALWVGDPGEAGASGGTEVSTAGTGYIRKVISFGVAANGVSKNDTDVAFDQATSPWGELTHITITDAVSGGNILFYGTLSSAKTIGTDDYFTVASDSLTVTLT